MSEMELSLDINNELYPLEVNQRFSLVLAKSVRACGQKVEGNGQHIVHFYVIVMSGQLGGSSMQGYDQTNQRSLADDYDYVMHGRVYKYEEDKTPGSKRVYVARWACDC